MERLLAMGYAHTLRRRYGEETPARVRELLALVNTAGAQPNPRDYLSHLVLGDPGAINADPMGVTLSTIHQAKGLEWEAVYVIGLTDGVFPPAPALMAPAAMREERRLFYVATTRARRWLYWLSPSHPRGEGIGLPHPVSRFVAELDPTLYDTQEAI